LLYGTSRWRSLRKDEVNPETDQLGREVGEPSSIALSKSPFDSDVLTLDPAEVVQSLPECLAGGYGFEEENIER